MILLLCGDMSLNTGPPQNSQTDSLGWNEFDKKGLHFLHINLYSFLPKIEEIKNIAKKSKATVIDISETKLDGIIFDAEIYIEVSSIVRCDRDMTSVSALKIFFLKMLKPSLWIFSFENQALICSYS